MAESMVWFGALFMAGLLGSLHCVGMCGPILLAFSRLLPSPVPSLPTTTRDGVAAAARSSDVAGSPDVVRSSDAARRWRLALDLGLYHAGRIWTYGLLGFLAAWAGSGLRLGAESAGLQRTLAIVVACAVVLCGLVAWLGLPGGKAAGVVDTCHQLLHRRRGVLAGLLRAPQPSARFLVGMVMGFLPCAMTFSALWVVTTLPTPLHGAVAMLCFGLGTLPALSLVFALTPVVGRALSHRLGSSYAWWASRSNQWAALLLVAVGLFMLWRACGVDSTASHHHGMF